MGLKVENVNKSFGGKIAVNQISFEINKPGVFGLLGTNGAGKTTTIRMILGIIKKNSGLIEWNGKSIERKNVNFGYLPEERGLYPKTKVGEQILYFAKLKGMKKDEAEKALKYWMDKLKVSEYMNMPAEKLSKGNQQKIQFITSVIHNPELIILDEPFSGLDPVNTEILTQVILELVEKGKYIIMSSHQMVSIEEFCSDILILDRGKTILQGNLQEIRNEYKANRLEIITNQDITKYIDEIGLLIERKVNNNYILKLENEDTAQELLKLLSSQNIRIDKFELKKPSLHDIFIEKVGEK